MLPHGSPERLRSTRTARGPFAASTYPPTAPCSTPSPLECGTAAPATMSKNPAPSSNVRCGYALRKLAARACGPQVAQQALLVSRRRAGKRCTPALHARRLGRHRGPAPGDVPALGDLDAALYTFLQTLDERQRRWFASWESLRRCRECIRPLVARGRRELVAGKVLPGRAYRPRCGQESFEKRIRGPINVRTPTAGS